MRLAVLVRVMDTTQKPAATRTRGYDVRMQRSARGFTLLEMMVVLALMGIVLSLGAPSFTAISDRSNARSGNFQLAAFFRFGRSEAIRTGNPHFAVLLMGSTANATDDRVALFEVGPAANISTINVSTYSSAQLSGTAAPPANISLTRTLALPSRVGFGPSSGIPFSFTGAYSAVPKSGRCSFCGSSYGGVFFMTDGSIRLTSTTIPSATAAPLAGSVAISNDRTWASSTKNVYAVSLVRNGGIRAWEE